MSVLETALSLQPISTEEPCGPNLQYDVDFIELDRVSQGKPEQQYGETIIPAENPDWKEMKRLALSLEERTKDLRIICYLARAVLETNGLSDFCDCISLARGYVDQFWDYVHPQLDPEDDNDPTERVNILASLASKNTTVAQILKAPLIKSPLGVISMRDVLVGRGEIPAPPDVPTTDLTTIDAAFVDCDLDWLRQFTETIQQGYKDAVALEDSITDKVGSSRAVSMEELSGALRSIHEFLSRQLRMKEANQGSTEDGEAQGFDAPGNGGSRGRGVGGGPAISGEIRSRDDVLRTLDKICEYYERFEPSSPLPMLLKRAKRLATKSFLDILEDLTPDGVSQAKLIGGVDTGSQDAGEE